jgi:hypothetical protein
MDYLFTISKSLFLNSEMFQKNPAHSVFKNEAGRPVTLRFREVPARAEIISALSFFAQPLN